MPTTVLAELVECARFRLPNAVIGTHDLDGSKMIEQYKLVAHPQNGPRHIRSVEVRIFVAEAFWMLSYVVEPAHSLALHENGFDRRDGLWRSTCFELFVKPRTGTRYVEFNFAAPGAWNAYSFSDWRTGMIKTKVVEPPHLVDSRVDDRAPDYPGRYELDVVLTARIVPEDCTRMSLTAVIEEKDGTKSFWALAHPTGEPNFHHPACFVAELPSPKSA